MSSTTNEAVYRRLIEEGFNQGNLAVADELVAPGAIEHQRGAGGDGTEGAKSTIKYLRSAFADFHITIDELVAVGDKVWARQRGGGTNVGSFAGRPPTGKTAFIDVIDVAPVRGRKDGRALGRSRPAGHDARAGSYSVALIHSRG